MPATTLDPPQRRAFAFVEDQARTRLADARRSLAQSLRDHGSASGDRIDRLMTLARTRARLTISFHPDRLAANGASVVRGLLGDGVYRSQFETGLSNGSLTAYPGGARDGWERTLFGGAYHEPSALLSERPKYGGVDLFGHGDGACPRFGSCFFVLHDAVFDRATLTWGDSHLGPAHLGTLATFETLLAPLCETLLTTGEVLGRTGLTVESLLAAWSAEEVPTSARPLGRALDAYIEAQIHGPISLRTDVAALVIDPSFDGTEVGEDLSALSRRYQIPLERRVPLTLSPSRWTVPEAFRGAAMRPLAERVVSQHGRADLLDAATIGRAAVSRIRHPEAWSELPTSEAETLQQLKQLWHVLVAFGQSTLRAVHAPLASRTTAHVSLVLSRQGAAPPRRQTEAARRQPGQPARSASTMNACQALASASRASGPSGEEA